MKKFKFFNLLVIAFVCMAIISCNDDETTVTPENNVSAGGKTLFGDYTQNITLKTGETYTVKGSAIFKEGTTLTVEPGTIINGDASVISYILIEQGAKIMAVGTADNPIIMTSTTKEAGAWGGLHICGKAPINVTGGTGESEIGGATYGGSDANDNSGTIKYVRLEYTGVALDDEHESNGVSFYGVGAGTTVEYIQVHLGADDGYEFFGGTVNVKWIVATGASDDSFDWTEGWSGKGQYMLAKQTSGNGDRGIEGDNNGNNNTASPYSNPTLSQVTLIGGWAGTDKGRYGMKLREGTKGQFQNIIVTGFDKRTIHVEHNQTLTNVNEDAIKVDYAVLDTNVSDKVIKYSVSKIDDGSGNEINDPNGPSVVESKKFETSTNVKYQTVALDASIQFDGGKDMSSDPFFSADTKIGAGTDWTTGWTVGL
jgi:hypothetical protein